MNDILSNAGSDIKKMFDAVDKVKKDVDKKIEYAALAYKRDLPVKFSSKIYKVLSGNIEKNPTKRIELAIDGLSQSKTQEELELIISDIKNVKVLATIDSKRSKKYEYDVEKLNMIYDFGE